MAEYIEREALIKAMEFNILSDPACPLFVAATVRQTIDCEPAADVKPLRSGEWQATKKHLWYKNKDGTPNIFAYSKGFCNGVVCRKCEEHFCVHCCPDWDSEDDDCYYEHYMCSCCGYEAMEKTAYCPNCGAKMGEKGENNG